MTSDKYMYINVLFSDMVCIIKTLFFNVHLVSKFQNSQQANLLPYHESSYNPGGSTKTWDVTE